MDKINSFYQNSICHICKKYLPNLKRCSSCKLFAYCSTEHQKLHWTDHKQFCKMVNILLKKDNKSRNHIFDINNIGNITYENWKQMRIDAKILWEHLLNRKLTFIEDQIWMFPRVCEICRISKQDNLFDCEMCYSVSYCCAGHQENHMSSHKKFCSLLKLCYEINYYLFTNELNITVDSIKSSDCNNLPESTENFVKKCIVMPQLKTDVYCYNDILIGDLVSPFLTIIHSLKICNLIKNGNYIKNSLVIHLVGASVYEESLPLIKICELFFHWIKNLVDITIILIGPDLTINKKHLHDTSCLLCSDCKNKKYKIKYERCLYHDYVISEFSVCADLIAAFNCGLHEYQKETEKDIWTKSIRSLTQVTNVPLITTAYTAEEALLDLARLLEFNNNLKIILKCNKNQFAGLRPFRDWGTENTPVFYQNNYVNIIQAL